jgi:DHA3 family multidrug efflux protein-like MFS transporter
MSSFHQLLANNLVQNVTNFTVWFALIFWVFLETRSVFATGMIGGLYFVLTAVGAIWFGSLVDHHRKKRVMLASSVGSLVLYGLSLGLLAALPATDLDNPYGAPLWIFVFVVMTGVIAGNLRMIALPTLVTVLIPEERRDKANGLVGMVSGIGFVITSAISGFLVAWGGMGATLGFAMALTVVAFLHLLTVPLDEPAPDAETDDAKRQVDIRGTIRVISGVPGLFALILFASLNNLLGGVFMALMDGYGLSLMEVEEWGLLWAGVSCAFILSGFVIARRGLGPKPLRTLLVANLIVWSVAAVFTIQSSVLLLGVGCFIWLFLGPFAEAAEQTVLQKVVPFERQGRVFGFAQSVESAASPLTAFLIGPLTQFVFIPFMTSGAGAEMIGDWYGTGPERGMALVFSVTGVIGILITVAAFGSRQYRLISGAYAAGGPEVAPAG